VSHLEGTDATSAKKVRGYCFSKPQYFWAPLSQQPVFMHIDWRAPQFVMQIER